MDAKVVAHEEYPANNIIIHEDFDNETMINNIALLKTDTAMEFNNLIQPICFLSRKLHVPPALRNCWVAGWNPTSAVNAFLLLEEAVCMLAVGVTWMNHSRAYLNNSGCLRFCQVLEAAMSARCQSLPVPHGVDHAMRESQGSLEVTTAHSQPLAFTPSCSYQADSISFLFHVIATSCFLEFV